MEREIFVHIDLVGEAIFVGRLWTRVKGRVETASFEYDASWLKRPDSFSLEPALMVGEGAFHASSDKPIFGSIGDSAPDRWGRALMRRAERLRASQENATPKTLFESDYLLQVNDLSRLGALRFSLKEGGPFLTQSSENAIPPLIELPKLLSALKAVIEDKETAEELRLVLAPGSSLGGARPKASVIDKNGDLLIAKFPHKDDDIDIVMWEALGLSLAEKAGISIPKWRIEKIGSISVLLLKRFDRSNSNNRIPFISAMSMLDAKDNDTHSYLEIGDAIRQNGAAAKSDLKQLWMRIVFNILISNTDDHLRNHGFLYQDQDGWRLSPAYDLNPVPVDICPRILSTNITENEATASLDLAFEVASNFEIDHRESIKLVGEVGKVVATWKEEAKKLGIPSNAINRMSSAFEHEDLRVSQL